MKKVSMVHVQPSKYGARARGRRLQAGLGMVPGNVVGKVIGNVVVVPQTAPARRTEIVKGFYTYSPGDVLKASRAHEASPNLASEPCVIFVRESQPKKDSSLRKAFGLFKKLGMETIDGVEYQEAVRKDWD